MVILSSLNGDIILIKWWYYLYSFAVVVVAYFVDHI